MYDTAPISFQRSRGLAEVGINGGGRLSRLFQQGCAKAFLPRSHTPEPEVVFLNTAGGVTGGDSLNYRLDVGAGTTVTATTQTAERAYRASIGSVPGRMSVHATVGAGATLHWLPQETILFDGAVMARDTTIDLGTGATLLYSEMLVFGRAAMGETVSRLDLTDRRRITRDGRPVLVEPLAITDDRIAASTAGAGLGQARAMATVALVGQGAEDALGSVRAVLADRRDAAASAWDGKLVIRALSPDPTALRRLVAEILTTLRGRALPRVWQV